MARAIKISSVSGALTVTITGPNGGTPVVYADSSFSSVQSMPATIADTATTTFWLQGPGKYTLSVKTSGGTEIAADNNSTRTVDVETDGTVAALNYDARTLATVSGDSGHSTAGSAASGAVGLTTVAASGTSQTVTGPSHGTAAYKITLTGNCTFTLTGGTAAEEVSVNLYLLQDGTGGRSVTWPANVIWGTSGAPTLSTAANKMDILTFTSYDGGTSWHGMLAQVGTRDPGVPDQVTGLIVTAGDTQNVLTWSAPANNGAAITAYKVYRSTTTGTETLETTLGNVLTFTDTTLTNGTTYFYKVSAVNSYGEGALSAEASGTPAAGVTTLAADTFTAADSTTSLTGRTTETGAKVWTRTASSTTTWGISTNRAYKSSSGTSLATSIYVDVAQADVTVQADYTTSASGADDDGLLLRYVDDSNWMNVMVDPAGVYVQKKIAGSQTNVANWANTMTAATTYTLKAVMSGSSVNVYVNGTLRITTTVSDAALLTATKHGLFALNSGTHVDNFWDNFSVTQP